MGSAGVATKSAVFFDAAAAAGTVCSQQRRRGLGRERCTPTPPWRLTHFQAAKAKEEAEIAAELLRQKEAAEKREAAAAKREENARAKAEAEKAKILAALDDSEEAKAMRLKKQCVI